MSCFCRSKFERRREITEQIALGMPARPSGNGEVMYDERLLNKTRGMDSGFADDDAYNVYDKPWSVASNLQQHLCHPSKNFD